MFLFTLKLNDSQNEIKVQERIGKLLRIRITELAKTDDH